jgi:hypothetical protein
MKKVSAREFARKRGQVINALKAHQAVAVTGHGKSASPASRPGASPRQRLRAKELLKTLSELPMTEAEGDQILKKFAGEAVF